MVHVRRNVYALNPEGPEISALKTGVEAMKNTPEDDPRSWAYQAAIHGSQRRPPDEQAARIWNMCQHASFFFLSWHRMYIYFFERILRAASGDPGLTLPYWNYSDPAQRALPEPFREPAARSNPLYVMERNAGINEGALLPPAAVAFEPTFNIANFLPRDAFRLSFGGGRIPSPEHFSNFTGALENQPHNIVHVLVGGSGWMSNPDTAAQDPIFWLHHANIDRLWERWLDRGGDRANPVDDRVWIDTQFPFLDEDGDEVGMSGREIVETAAQLDYVYDDEPAGPVMIAAAQAVVSEVSGGEAEPRLVGSAGTERGEEMIELGAEPTTVAVELEGLTGGELAAVTEASAAGERIVLGIDGVQYDEPPGITYEVYLNLPEEMEPDYTSNYYVGNVGFFGMEAHGHGEGHEGGGHGHPARLSFDVTDNVRALSTRGEWDANQAVVSFFARGLVPAPGAETSVAEAQAMTAATSPEPAGRPRIERVVLSTE